MKKDTHIYKNAIVLAFPAYATQAKEFALAVGLPYTSIKLHHFPDAESKLQLPEKLPNHVIL